MSFNDLNRASNKYKGNGCGKKKNNKSKGKGNGKSKATERAREKELAVAQSAGPRARVPHKVGEGYSEVKKQTGRQGFNIEEYYIFSTCRLCYLDNPNIKYVEKIKELHSNHYTINADKGEIDLNNSDVIFLENVKQIYLNRT